MNEKKVIDLCNSFIANIDEYRPTYLELIAFCAQMLIRSGCAMSKGQYTMENLNWAEIESTYYASKTKDIIRAVLLSGGNIMKLAEDCSQEKESEIINQIINEDKNERTTSVQKSTKSKRSRTNKSSLLPST